MRTTDEDLQRQHDSGEIDTETYLVKLKFNMDRRDNAAEKEESIPLFLAEDCLPLELYERLLWRK